MQTQFIKLAGKLELGKSVDQAPLHHLHIERRIRPTNRFTEQVRVGFSKKGEILAGRTCATGALDRALIVGKKLLLLDVPFEGVAPALAQRLIEVIATLRTEGLSVLPSESDHVHSDALLDNLFVIERGEPSSAVRTFCAVVVSEYGGSGGVS